MNRFSHSAGLATALITLLIAVPVMLPIVAVLFAGLMPAGEAWAHIRENLLAEYVANTVLLMLATGLGAGLLGVGTAWLTSRFRFPGDRWLAPALVLPLALPTYIAGYVYADLLEYAGPVQSQLRALTGWGLDDYVFPEIRSLGGAATVMALVLYPYVYLLARANLEAQAGALADAARSLGVSGWRLFTRITLPLLRPALAGGLALVLMETAAEFGVVEHFGVPTLTTGVFRTWLAMGEKTAALKLAACLFLVVMVLVLLEQATRRGERSNLSAPSVSPARTPLTGLRGWGASALCAVPLVFGFVLPVAILAGHALGTGDPLFGRRFLTYVTNSLTVAGLAALLCVIAAVWLAYAERLHPSRWLSIGIRTATLGYALPGLVLAIGALAPLSATEQALARWTGGATGLLLTGTIFGLLFVYVARFLTIAFNAARGGLGQIHPALDDAARSLGARPLGVLRRVHVPLLSGTVAYAVLLVFIDVMKELPATLVMRPFNFETLATRVYRLASDERLPEASTAAVLIVLLSLVPTVLLARQARRRPSRA
ncbi:MAG: iron ABC transporter permease [Xanthomonadales bacterium]|nr:iron ABC transporter permease [Xanthomonadales bacterium]